MAKIEVRSPAPSLASLGAADDTLALHKAGAETITGSKTLDEGVNLVLGTTTGSKIGTATTQKLGFFNATPVVQPSSTTDLRTALINLGLYATGGATPLNLNGGALTAGTATISSHIGVTGNTTTSAGFYGGGAVVGDGAAGVRLLGTAASGMAKFAIKNSVAPREYEMSVNDTGTWTLYDVTGGGTVVSFTGFAMSLPNGNLTMGDGRNFVFNTTTGTKIGTGTSQKLAFYNATPIAQQTGVAVTAAGVHAALVSLGLITA